LNREIEVWAKSTDLTENEGSETTKFEQTFQNAKCEKYSALRLTTLFRFCLWKDRQSLPENENVSPVAHNLSLMMNARQQLPVREASRERVISLHVNAL
jgi:hypothetical protein